MIVPMLRPKRFLCSRSAQMAASRDELRVAGVLVIDVRVGREQVGVARAPVQIVALLLALGVDRVVPTGHVDPLVDDQLAQLVAHHRRGIIREIRVIQDRHARAQVVGEDLHPRGSVSALARCPDT